MTKSGRRSRSLFRDAGIKAFLSNLLPHDRSYVEQRLAYLDAFMRVDQARLGRGRCRTRAEVSQRHGMSVQAAERLEFRYKTAGVAALLPPGRRRKHVVPAVLEGQTLSIPERLRAIAAELEAG